jgi:beta-glucosidase
MRSRFATSCLVAVLLLGCHAYAYEREEQSRLADYDDEGMAPAPAPSGEWEPEDPEEFWAVSKKRAPSSPKEKDGKLECPEWDEYEEGSDYPFYLGFADSAYQSEGAATKDGRGPSIWDTFSKWSGSVQDNANGDIASDFYGNYKEDVQLLKKLGIRTYRFSISWSRILPKGNGTINEKGLEFYSKLVDELLDNCIEPHITLYHWDLPFSLQLAYKGWIDYKVTDDFADYAEIVFKKLGDRVKQWTTFASPYSFCMLGYGWGSHAPGRCADCPGGGDVSTEPFLCARNVVIGHAKVVKPFREHVKDGKLGINLNVDWAEPWDASNGTHIKATERHFDLAVRIFADPLYKGRFPKAVPELTKVPRLTEKEVELLKDAKPDFFGLSHYTANFIKDDPYSPEPMRYQQLKESKNKTEFGEVAGNEWLVVYPEGLRKTLVWVAEEYDDPEIVVLENGVSVPGEGKRKYPDVLNDEFRMKYFKGYLNAAKAAVKEDDVDLKGYYAWKFLDGFEWSDGYDQRFGMVYVNLTGNLDRHPKNSAYWIARKFNVLPADVDYEKSIYLPDEDDMEEERKQHEREQEKRKALGGNAPIRLDEFASALPPATWQPDPATDPFRGGR